ncbi:MAG: hypothetical protein V1688_01790 [bacterium]
MRASLKYLPIIILAILQLSFLKGLGWPWFNINLLLCMAVFFTIYGGMEENLPPIIIGAVVLDLFSGNIFGIITLAIFLTCAALNFTYLHLFTNQSLPALLVLGAIGILLYNFFIAVFYYFFYWINLSNQYIFIDGEYWSNLIWKIFFISIILIFFYRLSDLKFAKR